jgi:hypothetical protein
MAALAEGLRLLHKADPMVMVEVQDSGEYVLCAAGEERWRAPTSAWPPSPAGRVVLPGPAVVLPGPAGLLLTGCRCFAARHSRPVGTLASWLAWARVSVPVSFIF